MLYRILGMVVWRVAKRYLRRKGYGTGMLPRPVMLIGALALAAVGAILGRRRLGASSGA